MQNKTQIFPPKEVAMELRKVGFNWECVGWYVGYHEDDNIKPIIEPEQGILNSNIENGIGSCTAPTYDQVIGWFASKGVQFNICCTEELPLMYRIDLFIESNCTYFNCGFRESRQQSLLTAFREAIKLIEK